MSIKLQQFRFKKLSLQIFYDSSDESDNLIDLKKLIIIYPGLPQFLDKEFFEKKIKKGQAYLKVDYYGSWMSGGNFTPDNCVKTINDTMLFLKKASHRVTYDSSIFKIKAKSKILVGYSFAAQHILRSNVSKKFIDKIYLFAPLVFLNKNQVKKVFSHKLQEDSFYNFSLSYLNFMRAGYDEILRGIKAKSWDVYFSGNDKKSLIRTNKSLPQIYIYMAENDDRIPLPSRVLFKNLFPSSKINVIKDAGHNLDGLFIKSELN